MTHPINLLKKSRLVSTVVALTLFLFVWFGYTGMKGYSPNPLTYLSCTSETGATFEDVAGWDFEAEDTSCDTLAKDEEVRVFATPTGRLKKLFARRRLVFAYDPGAPGTDGLIVRATDAKRVLISLPQVSQIFQRNQTVGEIAIDYDIRQIDYP